jgi:hypothetical protein
VNWPQVAGEEAEVKLKLWRLLAGEVLARRPGRLRQQVTQLLLL